MAATSDAPSDKPAVCRVIGIPLAITDYSRAVDQLRRWASKGDRAYIAGAAASHCVTTGRHDPEFGAALETFDMVTPDGMPLVWVMNRSLSEPLKDRVYGPTLMLRTLESVQNDPLSHAFVGGSQEMLDGLRAKLAERFPNLKIAFMYSPPFGPWPSAEDDQIVEKIKESGARYVWVGLGCPKQEFWLARNKHRLPAGVHVSVGAAFAFHAGRVKQAPLWMQKRGLEWLFRLVTEPGRLWKRYLVYNSLFIYYVARDAILGAPRPDQMAKAGAS